MKKDYPRSAASLEQTSSKKANTLMRAERRMEKDLLVV